MHIILHQPEIPSNTGNIGRTCVATGTSLHLIEPLGFQITEKQLLRAGMDYWKDLDVTRYVNYADFSEKHPGAKIWMATTKARRSYDEVTFGPDDYIMFGKESAGIPEEILVENEDRCIRIPMGGGIRSLNLANSVAIVLYEALRQQGFSGLERGGELHRLHWKEDGMSEQTLTEEQKSPVYEAGVKIAPSAVVLGNVHLGKQVSIWHNATVRADNETLVIGDESNIQDNCVLHTGRGFPVSLGKRVTVGHGAIVHGCTVEDEVIVGMGAILLNGCKIGTGSVIGAGALVAEGREIPPHSLVLGVPGKVVRELTKEDLEGIRTNAAHYVEIAAKEL